MEKDLILNLPWRISTFWEVTSRVGAWRSLVARLLWEQDVACSNHVAPTTFLKQGISKSPIPCFFVFES